MSSGPTANAGRVLRLAAVALLVTAAGAVILIWSGAFDPLPASPVLQTERPGRLSLPGHGEAFFPQPASPAATNSIRLTAAHAGGELDSGYGLRLGDDAQGLTVAVSPLGYVTVWETRDGDKFDILPWQTWPHVRLGDEANEIWLVIEGDGEVQQVMVWVNRELLWQGTVQALPVGLAVWLASFDSPVTVDFQTVEWIGG